MLPNWIGDVAMCTPAIRALYRRFPHASIIAIGKKACCDLVQGLPYIAETYPLPPRPTLRAMVYHARRLARYKPALAVVFPHSFRAALFAWMTGARQRIGYDRGGRAWLLTHRVAPYREDGQIVPIYMTKEYYGLVAALGCSEDEHGLELCATEEARRDVAAQIGERTPGVPIIGFAPGAAFGPSKRWLPERYAQVADALAETLNARCVLITGPGEEETRDAVLKAARTPLILYDAGKPSVEKLKAVIAQLDLLIGNDSGPRHIAVAFKVPVVCVMGSTSPRYSEGPYELGCVVRVNDVPCSPCQKPVCELGHHACMTHIQADDVARVAREIVQDE